MSAESSPDALTYSFVRAPDALVRKMKSRTDARVLCLTHTFGTKPKAGSFINRVRRDQGVSVTLFSVRGLRCSVEIYA